MFCTHWERLSLTYCTGVLCSLFSNSGILEKYGWLTFLLLIILLQPSVWAWARPTPGSEALRRHHNGEPTLQLQERPPWTGLTTGTPIPVYKPLTPSITSCNGCAATRFGWISTTTRPVSRSTQLKYFCNDPSIYKISFTIFFGGKIPNQLSLSSLVLVCTIDEALKLPRFCFCDQMLHRSCLLSPHSTRLCTLCKLDSRTTFIRYSMGQQPPASWSAKLNLLYLPSVILFRYLSWLKLSPFPLLSLCVASQNWDF